MASFEQRTKTEWRVTCAAQPLHNRTLSHAKAAQQHAERLIAQGLAGVRISEHGVTAWVARVRMTAFPEVNRTFSTRKDAEEWARVTEGEMARRQYVDHRMADRTSLAELLRKYDETRLSDKPAAHPDRTRLRTLADTTLAKMRMSALKPQHLAEHRDARLKVVKGSTVRKELELIGRVIGLARREWGLSLALNPASGEHVSRPKPEPGDERDRRLRPSHSASPRPLEPGHLRAPSKGQKSGSGEAKRPSGWVVDEAVVRWMQVPQTEEQALFRALRYPHLFQPRKPDPKDALAYDRAWRARREPKPKARDRKGGRHWAPVSLGLESAMRRGELQKLLWRHVAADHSYLLLPATITKNRKERIVPLTLRGRRILRAEGLKLGRWPLPDERVFGFSANALRLAFERARERAGSRDLRFHDLRHEATSVLFEDTNLRETEIGSITGHTDPRMLQRYNNKRADKFVKRFQSSFLKTVSTTGQVTREPPSQTDSGRVRPPDAEPPPQKADEAPSPSGLVALPSREVMALPQSSPLTGRAEKGAAECLGAREGPPVDLSTLVRAAAGLTEVTGGSKGISPSTFGDPHVHPDPVD